jgi:hypothetical protein
MFTGCDFRYYMNKIYIWYHNMRLYLTRRFI